MFLEHREHAQARLFVFLPGASAEREFCRPQQQQQQTEAVAHAQREGFKMAHRKWGCGGDMNVASPPWHLNLPAV